MQGCPGTSRACVCRSSSKISKESNVPIQYNINNNDDDDDDDDDDGNNNLYTVEAL